MKRKKQKKPMTTTKKTIQDPDPAKVEMALKRAGERFERMGVRNKDALHLACAVAMECDYFLTTDDQLVKRVSGVTDIKVTDPVSFIREEME